VGVILHPRQATLLLCLAGTLAIPAPAALAQEATAPVDAPDEAAVPQDPPPEEPAPPAPQPLVNLPGPLAPAGQVLGGALDAVHGQLENVRNGLTPPAQQVDPGPGRTGPPPQAGGDPDPTVPNGGDVTDGPSSGGTGGHDSLDSPGGGGVAHGAGTHGMASPGLNGESSDRDDADVASMTVLAGRSAEPTASPPAAADAANATAAKAEGEVVSLPRPAVGERGGLERIVAIVPLPVDVALAVMAALLALMTFRSVRDRRRLAAAEHLARTDGLTGLSNRQDLEGILESLIARAHRSGRPVSVALIDLDHFKAINDDFGHAAGDATLRNVARALTSELRLGDHVGRYGGEEFLAILPDLGAHEALLVAERIRERVAAMPRKVGRPVTASLGVASLPGDAANRQDLLAAADRALYAAKEAGRDRVFWADAVEARDRPAAEPAVA
jgi:diguanylate cyclase (GGDEF)-like protein